MQNKNHVLYLNLLMINSHFVLEKLYPVNTEKNLESYTILACLIYNN